MSGQPEGAVGPPRRLLAALAVQDPAPETEGLVEAARSLVEEVVLPALGPDLRWTTTVIRPSDDLERGSGPPRSAGRNWVAANSAGTQLEAVYVSGVVPLRRTLPPDPRAEPVHVLIRRPPTTGPATVAVSVHEWALPAGLTGGGLAQRLVRWLLATAVDLDAETGYLALDVADAFDPASSWELAVGASPGLRDVTATVWGYGWVTLLSAAHAEVVGGAAGFAGVPGAVLRDGPGGRLAVRLADDPARVHPDQVAALRAVLQPVLPIGGRSLEQWRALADAPHVVAPPYVL